jgi:hypothetical protein
MIMDEGRLDNLADNRRTIVGQRPPTSMIADDLVLAVNEKARAVRFARGNV